MVTVSSMVGRQDAMIDPSGWTGIEGGTDGDVLSL